MIASIQAIQPRGSLLNANHSVVSGIATWHALLQQRRAIDVALYVVQDGPMAGTYHLPFHPKDYETDDLAPDYADASQELWVWSIGRAKRAIRKLGVKKGDVYAALDSRFYGPKEWECIWLR